MEQRTYQGNVEPEAVADYLVQQFDPQPNLQAQKLGQGTAFMVQIARGDDPAKKKNAVSLTIARPAGQETGLVITMGQQEWITPDMAMHGLVIGLIGMLITPWALFGLLWPV